MLLSETICLHLQGDPGKQGDAGRDVSFLCSLWWLEKYNGAVFVEVVSI